MRGFRKLSVMEILPIFPEIFNFQVLVYNVRLYMAGVVQRWTNLCHTVCEQFVSYVTRSCEFPDFCGSECARRCSALHALQILIAVCCESRATFRWTEASSHVLPLSALIRCISACHVVHMPQANASKIQTNSYGKLWACHVTENSAIALKYL